MNHHPARVSLTIRTNHPNGHSTYEEIDIHSWYGDGTLTTYYPPAVGDVIAPTAGRMYRVIERYWSHAAYGSVLHPHGNDGPMEGPHLHCIVEPASGPYRNQAPTKEQP